MNLKAYFKLSPARLVGAAFVVSILNKVVFPVFLALKRAGFFEEYKHEVSNSSY